MLGECLYQRADGTLAFFFSTQALAKLARGAGLEVLQCEYACVALQNRKNGKEMRRVFVHGLFRLPEAVN